MADLRGVARLASDSPIARFVAIGVASTGAYALLFLALRTGLPAQAANVTALAITAVANTAANRRFTFGVRGRRGMVREHALGFAIFVTTVLITGGALALIGPTSRLAEVAVLVASSLVATATRYVALRFWVFGRRRSQETLSVG